ncbi:MAG: discoidin domain-containing protein, partial [Sphingobacteriaceae bacterium]
TIWSTLKTDSAAAFTPGEITIDLGKKDMVLSITYLPRQDKKLDGIVDQYTIFTSDDNKNWREVKSGEFSNIRANPIKQYIFYKGPVLGRYIRFIGKRSVKGNGITAAEIGITNFEY